MTTNTLIDLMREGMDARFRIPLGEVGGVSSDVKFGQNPTINTNTVPEDITNLGGIYTGQPDGDVEQIEIFSDSANDTSGGTGARTVKVTGLDANWLYKTETVSLAGLTGVVPESTWKRVFRAACMTYGSLGVNDGAITIRHNLTTANVFAIIDAGDGQTLVGARTIPADKKCLIHRVRLSLSDSSPSGSIATVDLNIREPGEGFRMRDRFTVSDTSPVSELYDFGLGPFAGQSDIKLTVKNVSSNGVGVLGAFGYTLHDNELFTATIDPG